MQWVHQRGMMPALQCRHTPFLVVCGEHQDGAAPRGDALLIESPYPYKMRFDSPCQGLKQFSDAPYIWIGLTNDCAKTINPQQRFSDEGAQSLRPPRDN